MSDDEVVPPPPAGAPAWMATFADLCTLLLTFFVLLLSFANMDKAKFQEMLGSMEKAFGYQTVSFGNTNPKVMSTNPEKQQAPIEALDKGNEDPSGSRQSRALKELGAAVKAAHIDSNEVHIAANNKGVVIRLNEGFVFTSGSAKLQREAFVILEKVIPVLQWCPHNILIEGHTDKDQNPNRKRFGSNWEISSERATTVLQYLIEVGGIDPARMGVAGYADMHPLVANTSDANRNLNRRVEIICHEDLERIETQDADELE